MNINFSDKVIKDLVAYKHTILGISKPGIFIYRGEKLEKEHILLKKDSDLNILTKYRKDFYDSKKSHISFHRYFHHLNSSQALCINLFLPLIVEGRLDIVLEALGINKKEAIGAQGIFEKESEIEIVGGNERRTSFDFYIETKGNIKLYFEVKYTEREFGKAKDDKEHQEKFKKTYQSLLNKNRFIKDEFKEMKLFLENYQIMRNLVHLDDNSFVVFLYPEANKKINDQAKSAYNNILTENAKNKFKILLLETIINNIGMKIRNDKLLAHYKEFKLKYLNYLSPIDQLSKII